MWRLVQVWLFVIWCTGVCASEVDLPSRSLRYYASGVSVTTREESNACYEGYPAAAVQAAEALEWSSYFTDESNWHFYHGETCDMYLFDDSNYVKDSGGMYES